MTITYQVNVPVDPHAVVTLFRDSGIHRPYDDLQRVTQMVEHANLTVTAWNGHQLIGIARGLTDWCYCCYLSDLAVDPKYQRSGIGTALLDRVREEIGDAVTLILVSAPDAVPFYERIGLPRTDQAFVLRRKR
ncbi:MAG: GNAT family N-acetyltransferase [Firmicutes bacterium]|nr:GNAT family N-acetyltransferase [Bacillota bacterium]